MHSHSVALCLNTATQWLYVWTPPLSGSMSEHSHSVALCLKPYLVLYIMCANRKGSGDTAWMHRLAWAIAGRLSLCWLPEPLLVAWAFTGRLSHCWSPEPLLVAWAFTGCLSHCWSPEPLLVAWAFTGRLSHCWSPEPLLVAWAFTGRLSLRWLHMWQVLFSHKLAFSFRIL